MMKQISLAIVPLLVLAQSFTLIINTKSGQQIKVAVDDVVDMVFEQDSTPEPVQLDAPNVTATVNGAVVKFSWSPVANASGYQYSIDKGTPANTTSTSISLPAQDGTHTISVIAKGDNELYLDSDPGTASYTYSLTSVAIATGEVTYNSITATFTPTPANQTYYCAVIPADNAKTDAEIIAWFKSQSLTAHNAVYTLTQNNLAASSNYVVAAYVNTPAELVFKKEVRTPANNSFTPGTSGTLYAYGCDATSGWYDVNKIYNNASSIWPGASDSNMCWACSVSGCLQWWMDEYEKEFGQRPELRYDLPATSQYYSSPMMEIMVSTFPDDAYDAFWAYKWFFIPIKNPDSMSNNGHPTFKEDSPYKYGGFMNRDEAFLNAYSKKYTAYNLFPLSDPADKIEKAFNDVIYDLLDEGVVEITVNNGIHSLICWGVDYVVKDDGTRKVTRMYIAENGGNSNRINALEVATVTYVTGDVKLSNGWNNLTSMTVLRSPRVVKLP